MAMPDLFLDVELITTGTGGFSGDSWKALLPGPLSLCSTQSGLIIFVTHNHLRFEDLRRFPSAHLQHHITASASITKALFFRGHPLSHRPVSEIRGPYDCWTTFPGEIYYSIHGLALPPSNLTGQHAYSGEDNSSTTFLFYHSTGSNSVYNNHLCLAIALSAWSDVDEQLLKVWARPSKRLVIINPFSSPSKPKTLKENLNRSFVILMGYASAIKISGGFTEIYFSSFMSYISLLKNLPASLPGLFLSTSLFFLEEKTLPPFPLPMERDDSSASLSSVCFSFLIGLLSCGAVFTGPEDATEITSVFLVDEVWTSTSHYVTILQLSDIVVKAPPTHSSIVSNSLSSSVEDLSCLVYLSVIFYAYGQRGWIIPSFYCMEEV